MVRKNTKVIGTMSAVSMVTGMLFLLLLANPTYVKAENTTFEVNVVESLTVAITTPDAWASGDAGTFLRNTIALTATSNNSAGLTATMYANNTSLSNTSSSSITLPTLSSSATRGSFTDNKWGYSLDATTSLNGKTYNESDDGNNNSNYYPLTTSTSPESILTIDGAGTATRKIYLGAKSTTAQASGTYTGTVVISVITGTVNTNDGGSTPTEGPDNPVTPSDDPNSGDNNASYTGANDTGVGVANSTAGTTVYTTTSTNTSVTPNTTTTTTEVSLGDNTDAYPKGVTTVSNINEGTPLATGLAITSAVAATTGIVFFIIAKRREDEEDEDEY